MFDSAEYINRLEVKTRPLVDLIRARYPNPVAPRRGVPYPESSPTRDAYCVGAAYMRYMRYEHSKGPKYGVDGMMDLARREQATHLAFPGGNEIALDLMDYGRVPVEAAERAGHSIVSSNDRGHFNDAWMILDRVLNHPVVMLRDDIMPPQMAYSLPPSETMTQAEMQAAPLWFLKKSWGTSPVESLMQNAKFSGVGKIAEWAA